MGFSAPSPAAVAIDTDVPCFKCQYNVRGLPTAGRCPECGYPIADSIQQHALAIVSTRQRANLIRAGACLSISTWMVAGTIPMAIGLGFVCSLLARLIPAIRNLDRIMVSGIGIWMCVQQLMWAVGTYYLPLPGHHLNLRDSRWPKFHRLNVGLALAAALFMFVAVVMFSVTIYMHSVRSVFWSGAFAAAAGAFLCIMGSIIITGRWLAALAQLLNAKATRFQTRLLTGTLGLANGIWALSALFYSALPEGAGTFLLISFLLAIPAMFILTPWAAILLTFYTWRFKKMSHVAPA